MTNTDDEASNWLAAQMANQMMFISIFEALGHTSSDPAVLLDQMSSLIGDRIDSYPLPGRSESVIAKAKEAAKAVVNGVITSAKNQKIH